MAYRFELWQDGIRAVVVDAARLADAWREIRHYALLYGQDGPIEIREVPPPEDSDGQV